MSNSFTAWKNYREKKEAQETQDLLQKMNPSPEQFFSIDGELFKGDPQELCLQYVQQSPSKKFIIWLIDKGLRVHVSSY